MIIRVVKPSDAGQLLEIYTPYVTDSAVSFEYAVPSEAEFIRRISLTLSTYPYIVAEENGIILGYAYAGTFHAREAYLHCVETSIYVRNGYHSKGIGKALYSKLEELLLKQNVFILYACISKTDDAHDMHLTDASIRFHEKVGYHLTGLHSNCGYKFNKWYSIVWMEKLLCELPSSPESFIPFSSILNTRVLT